MNKRQYEVQKYFLNREEVVIKRLHQVYQNTFDELDKQIDKSSEQIQKLTEEINNLSPDDPQVEILKSRRQSLIYQDNYQQVLQEQVSNILDKMQNANYTTVQQYLQECYDDGFIGAMYDLHGQEVPLMLPMNQINVVNAVQLNSKISEGLYTRLGQNIQLLKGRITAQVSMMFSTGKSYEQTAERLRDLTGVDFNKTVRIARTEGHRVQVESAMDAMKQAKDAGADILKQWDSTLDGRTRPHHRKLDGKLKELHEKFVVDGKRADSPGHFGIPAEDINCRCALLQRARWALDEDELNTLKERAEYYGLDKSRDFRDFKKKYLKAVEPTNKPNIDIPADEPVNAHVSQRTPEEVQEDINILSAEITKVEDQISDLIDIVLGTKKRKKMSVADAVTKIDELRELQKQKEALLTALQDEYAILTRGKVSKVQKTINLLQGDGVTYRKVEKLTKLRTDDEIISVLGDGDLTDGSCSSVGLAYIGQKFGYNVLDFRGGESMEWFASKINKRLMWEQLGVEVLTESSFKGATPNAVKLIKQAVIGKEYYMGTGCHAAIVRKTSETTFQYLELQSHRQCGWVDFDESNARWTFDTRFGGRNIKTNATMVDISQLEGDDDFIELLGYINTAESEQKRGKRGRRK